MQVCQIIGFSVAPTEKHCNRHTCRSGLAHWEAGSGGNPGLWCRTWAQSIEKPTSSKDATMSSRSSSMPPKAVTNPWKIESWDLPDLVFMIFSKPLILNDSTMNFMVFQVLGLPRTTRNPPKPSPGIILKLCIEMTPSKIEFLLEKGVPGPPKCHPKSMKNWPWTSKGPPWRSKGPQELAKASHGVKNDPKSSSQQPKHVENGHQAPVTSTGYRSRVAFEGPAAGGEALKINNVWYITYDM